MLPDLDVQSLIEMIDAVSEAELEAIYRQVSRLYSDGELTDAQYELLDIAYRARTAQKPSGGARGLRAVTLRPTGYRSREKPRSPDREKSRQRRRVLGGSSALPPSIRKDFTEGQRSILFVIGEEVRRKGSCDWPIDRVAAQSGMCRTSVQDLLHKAKRAGLLAVLERPRKGQKSQTNIVRIASREWLNWLSMNSDRQRNIGSNRANLSGTTKNKIKKERGLCEKTRSDCSGGGGVSCPVTNNPMNPEKQRSPDSSQRNVAGLATVPVMLARHRLSEGKSAAGYTGGSVPGLLGARPTVTIETGILRKKQRRSADGQIVS
jgi:hypothetical protein